ncbi:hypothetical protein ACMFMG_004081 [Clarireedia jacksonii]
MEKYGRKKAFVISALRSTAFVFFQIFARSLVVLLIGELIARAIGGMFLTLVPTYTSEICPAALRSCMTSFINLALIVGALIRNGIIAGTHEINSHWAYSAPMASQWFFFTTCDPWYVSGTRVAVVVG